MIPLHRARAAWRRLSALVVRYWRAWIVDEALKGAKAMTGNMSGLSVGDVFQINRAHERQGWIGAFVLATEIKLWGIQGFVHHVETHEKYQRAYIRLVWNELDYIGHAALMPSDEVMEAADV